MRGGEGEREGGRDFEAQNEIKELLEGRLVLKHITEIVFHC